MTSTLSDLSDRGRDVLGGVRDRLGAELFHRVAGDEGPKRRDRIHSRPGPRWFEEDAEIRQVHADASMFIGGIRALLLQTLHPAAMQGVADHSGYRGDMWGRLARTSTYLATTTFGAADDAQAAVDMVRSIHTKIVGTMPDGTPYAANDPHLLMWVHVAQIDSFLLAHQVYGAAPLDQAGRDAYVRQAGEVAARLGVIDPPTTEAELREELARFRPELRGTEAARDAVSFLLWHPDLPITARPPYLVLCAAAIALMPAWTRWPLRLPLFPVTERTVVRALGAAATGTIRWAMTPPEVAAQQAQERQAG